NIKVKECTKKCKDLPRNARKKCIINCLNVAQAEPVTEITPVSEVCTLFKENFEEDYSEIERGTTWTILEEGGNKVLNCPGEEIGGVENDWASFGNEHWKNYISEFSFKLMNDQGFAFHFFSTDDNSYVVDIKEGEISLLKKMGDNRESLASAVFDYNLNYWYKLKTEKVENNVKVYLDNYLILNYNDGSLDTGQLRLETFGDGHIRIDNIKIKGDCVVETLLPVEVDVEEEACAQDSSVVWEQTNGPSGGITYDLAVNPSDPNIIYALTNNEGLYKTENAGVLWQEIDSLDLDGGQAVTIDPNNPNIVYIGTYGGIFKSSDSGNSWSKILNGLTAHNYFFDLEEEHPAMVRSIEVDPTNSNIIFAGTEDGRIYKSMNGGSTWELKSNNLDSRFVISSIRINYNNPDIVYATTGYWDFNPGGTAPIPAQESEEQVSTYIGSGKGVFKSIDGGESWFPINSGLSTWTNEYNDESGLITANGLAMDPVDPEILYLATHNEPTLGSDPEPLGISPLYKSLNGGEIWEPLVITTYDPGNVNAVAINPLDNTEIVINTGTNANFISNDAGNTWERISGSDLESNAFFLKLEYDPINTDNIYGASYYSSVLKSSDGGYTWSRSGNGITATAVYYVAVDPTDSNIAYAGTWEPTIFKTVDGGDSWQATSLKFSFGYTYGIIVDPNNPTIVYAGVGNTNGATQNQRVLFKSTDGGNSWNDINDGVLEEDRNIYFLAMDPMDSSKIYAGTENGVLYRTTTAGGSWEEVNPMITFTTINTLVNDPNNPTIIYAGTNSKYATGGGIYKTTNSGNSWQRLARYNSPRYTYAIAIDNSNPSILYSGDAKIPKLWKSSDSGDSWDLKLDLSENEKHDGIRSIATADNNIYAGITGKEGAIYTSNDQGNTWNELNNDLTFSTIHAIASDPNNENIVYAAPWGGGFFKSIDSGNSWTEIITPTISIPAIIVDPDNSNHLLIGDRTKPKIYESFNGGNSWSEIVALDEENYYRISTMGLHNGELYFNVFNKVTGMISLFVNGPMSGTTFKLEGGIPVEISNGVEGNIIIDFFSDNTNLYSISHIYGVHRLEGSIWVDISPDIDMGFNNIIVDEANNLYVSGASDIDMDLNFRVGDSNIVNNIYKSSDSGNTWSPLLTNNPFSSSIKKILQHPTNNNLLFAATSTGLWVSTDRGVSWTSQSNGLNFKNIGSMTVAENYVYLGTLGGGVYTGTINGDYSITWSAMTGPYPEIFNIQIKVDPTNSNTIYATSFPGGVFKSTDGGLTWMESNFALPSFKVVDPLTQGYYSLEIDPNNPNILYLGIFGKGVYKSTDGAATWIPMYGSMGGNREIMQKGITKIKVNPDNSNQVYLATNEGVYFSNDGAESWEEMNEGLGLRDVVSLTVSVDGSKVFAGTRGSSVWEASTSEMVWEQTSGPESEPRLSWIKIDPTNSNIIYLAFNPAGMYKTTDGGATWRETNVGLLDPVVYPIEINPSNPEEIYIGTGYQRDPATKSSKNAGLYKSLDGGERWFKSSGCLPKDTTVNTITIDPKDHNTLFIGTEQKGLFKSRDKGVTWQEVNSNNIENSQAIYSFAFDSTGNVAYTGTIPHSVWKTDLRTIPTCNNNGVCDDTETTLNCPNDCKKRISCPKVLVEKNRFVGEAISLYDPVCGVNSKTYPNKCEAERAGVKEKCKGKCPCR
ncbi:MAG: hypothetical protein KJ597_01605, partial [Nanoarchaeota archaeon]|nr:hypothetical protein [Nanoarchaeota archaeon]